MSQKNKIILCPNATRDIGYEISLKVMKRLEAQGRNAVICPIFDDDVEDSGSPAFMAAKLEDELPSAEMLIMFGGDGTILRGARAAADIGTPILGVNMGGKGFMAEIEAWELEKLDSILAGGFEIDNRMMLDVEIIRNGKIVHEDFALNDVVVRGDNKVIGLSVYGDGQIMSEFSGDGVIVATPTGSTAYSMAAGGPIVEPSAHNILITSICAHILEAKPFVLASDRRVSVKVGEKARHEAFLSADGCERVEIFGGDIINARKSGRYTRLVHLPYNSFYKKVSEKLGEKS